ncbi:MAG TPA: enoyl-CoA hydratase/isomerase family protein [Phenylobacterium sp.]|uniref:enoyl-CoA hydratase/isomerase family protein n=1 Tax=Phenylobacterium sp. TaxID=1871053 RepID=UPI002CDC3913|nr:enoyl-CoA hydratase/isomerase family protein [Phenylobacterium sp.]HXA38259.1 enoyl-CoA hydratase/isomerase family protein [Phenylobacterium sp.]
MQKQYHVFSPRSGGRYDSTALRIGAMLGTAGADGGGTTVAYEAGDYETITLERRGHVGVLTLNRPDRLNAINRAMMAEVTAAVATVKADDAFRALVVTGAGKGFCAGADLMGVGQAVAGNAPEPKDQFDRLDEMGWVGRWAAMWSGLDKPTIGAINGVAAGAGMSTALACDVRIGSEAARFKSVFIERSLSPDSGLSFFLPRIVGYAAAADIIFTSRAVGAEEAKSLGLLNRLAGSAELVDAAVDYANEMTRWPPVALRVSKRVLQHNTEATLEEALRYESAGLYYARRAPNDVQESRASFVEKRPGVYTGT